MKLLVIQPTGDKFGHFGIYTARLAQEIANRGHEVLVCTNRLEVGRFLSGPKKFELVEVGRGAYDFESYERQATSFPGRYWYGYFRNSWKIFRAGLNLCRKRVFDGVYVTDVEFMIAALALKLHGGPLPPIVMQVNASNFSFDEYPGGFIKKTYKVVQREVFRSAVGKQIKAFSILGDWHRERLQKQLRIDTQFPIELIPDGGGRFANPIAKDEARARLGITYTGDIFLFLGVLRRDKGLKSLARAIALLDQSGREFRIILAGFPLQYSLGEINDLLGLNDPHGRTIHSKLDYVDEAEMPTYFYAADCLLLPYNDQYKGSCGPLMKGACTFGLPVVVSDVSEMGALTRKHQLGFTATPGDPDDLAKAMGRFLDTRPQERAAMTERAFALGQSNSWPAMAQRYEALFDRLTS